MQDTHSFVICRVDSKYSFRFRVWSIVLSPHVFNCVYIDCLKGKPAGDKHYHGVGFAIRTRLVKHLEGKSPVGINERLMTMSFPLEGTTLSIISAYAPTLPQSDEIKDSFYGTLKP